MGKPKFPIGSFVCAKGYEDVACFYVYDYVSCNPLPYRLINLKKRVLYGTTANKLKTVCNINTILHCLLNKKPTTFNAVKKGNRLSSRRGDASWLRHSDFTSYNF